MTEKEIAVLDRVVNELRKTLDDLGKGNVSEVMKENHQYRTEIYTIAYDVVRGLRDAGAWIYE